MNKTFALWQFEIALAIKERNPIIFNSDFLKHNSIVPVDWELAQTPINTEDNALVSFQNGIHVASQNNAIIAFLEDARTKNLEELKISQCVHNYLEKFPQADYQTVNINLEGYTVFNTMDEAREYLLKTLPSSNQQHESDPDLVQAVINLIYRIDNGIFTLTVRNTVLKLPDEESVAVILFSANFQRNIAEIIRKEQVHVLFQIIDNWRTDVETYTKVVNNKFLNASSEP